MLFWKGEIEHELRQSFQAMCVWMAIQPNKNIEAGCAHFIPQSGGYFRWIQCCIQPFIFPTHPVLGLQLTSSKLHGVRNNTVDGLFFPENSSPQVCFKNILVEHVRGAEEHNVGMLKWCYSFTRCFHRKCGFVGSSVPGIDGGHDSEKDLGLGMNLKPRWTLTPSAGCLNPPNGEGQSPQTLFLAAIALPSN